MTVAELILALQAMPDKDAEACFETAEGDFDPIYDANFESHVVDDLWESFVVLRSS